MPAKNLVPFSTYLPPDVKQRLEEEAEKDERSAAALARKILTEWARDAGERK